MPLALFGLISCLALWDVFRCYGNRWGLDEYPVLRQTLLFIMQGGKDTLFLLLWKIRWLLLFKFSWVLCFKFSEAHFLFSKEVNGFFKCGINIVILYDSLLDVWCKCCWNKHNISVDYFHSGLLFPIWNEIVKLLVFSLLPFFSWSVCVKSKSNLDVIPSTKFFFFLKRIYKL